MRIDVAFSISTNLDLAYPFSKVGTLVCVCDNLFWQRTEKHNKGVQPRFIARSHQGDDINKHPGVVT